jgi:hypothetical protein
MRCTPSAPGPPAQKHCTRGSPFLLGPGSHRCQSGRPANGGRTHPPCWPTAAEATPPRSVGAVAESLSLKGSWKPGVFGPCPSLSRPTPPLGGGSGRSEGQSIGAAGCVSFHPTPPQDTPETKSGGNGRSVAALRCQGGTRDAISTPETKGCWLPTAPSGTSRMPATGGCVPLSCRGLARMSISAPERIGMPVEVHFRRACHSLGIGTQPPGRRLSNLGDRRKQLAGGGRDLAEI